LLLPLWAGLLSLLLLLAALGLLALAFRRLAGLLLVLALESLTSLSQAVGHAVLPGQFHPGSPQPIQATSQGGRRHKPFDSLPCPLCDGLGQLTDLVFDLAPLLHDPFQHGPVLANRQGIAQSVGLFAPALAVHLLRYWPDFRLWGAVEEESLLGSRLAFGLGAGPIRSNHLLGLPLIGKRAVVNP
jgi:hypothetical protein